MHLSLTGNMLLTDPRCDLIFATRCHVPAGFRWRHSSNLNDLDSSFEPDCQAVEMSQQLGKIFEDVTDLHDLIDSVHYVRDMIVRLDQYEREGRYPERLQAILRARNAVHHQLLCLPHADALEDVERAVKFTYELCRLGLLIFSNIALFPLPAESGVTERLTKMLSRTISTALETEGGAIWSKYSDILTWVIILAGITTISSTDYECLLNYLSTAAAFTSHVNWACVENELLSRSIWWPYMCNRAGRTMWDEASSIESHYSKYTSTQGK